MSRDSADPRIFVSYARSDGEAFAHGLREKLAAQDGPGAGARAGRPR
jgi:hypothetical protein